MARTATGTLSQKIPCHENPSTTAPPMTGPSATPSPETPPQIPMAIARRDGGTAAASRVRDSGMIAAAPAPCIARAAIRAPVVVDRAEPIEASVKSVIPVRNTRRRPRRSPRVAAGSMRVAKASV